jgi:lipopolysaccharide export LptBFGC system permease protein LptF
MRLILHRYILGELLKTFVLTTAAITLFLSLANAMGTLRERGLGPVDSILFILCGIPIMLVFAMPVAALLTTTLIYGRLASDNEITACRASGISTGMLLKPVFVLGLMIGAVTFLLHDRVIPWARYKAEAVGTENAGRILFHHLRTQGRAQLEESFITAKAIDGDILYGVVLTRLDSSGKGFKTYAPAARIQFYPPGDTPSWFASSPTEPRSPAPDPPQERRVTREQIAAESWDAEVVDFGTIFIKLFKFYGETDDRTIDARGSFGGVELLTRVRVMQPAQMTLGQLLRCYRTPEEGFQHKYNASRGFTDEQLKTEDRKLKAKCLAEMHSRYSMIVTCVLLVVLGAALGLVFRHGHILTAFFISMGPALFAIFCILLGVKLVQRNPDQMHSKLFIIWIGNIVVLILDVIFVARMARR